jgi:hypothetical protein
MCLSLCLSTYLPIYPCCSHLEHRESLFVSVQFLNIGQSVGLL